MKAIQITFDETLLEQLDEDEEVRKRGRSAILRQLVQDFLERKRQADIEARYRRGYADFDDLGPEFEGWEKMGVWPEEAPAGSGSVAARSHPSDPDGPGRSDHLRDPGRTE